MADYLYERGWPVTLISRFKFEYSTLTELADPKELEEIGFNYSSGVLCEIKKMKIIDIDNNIREQETNTVLLDTSVYCKLLYNKLKSKCVFIEDSNYIDKNNENVFIQQGVHGTLLKLKYVFSLNDYNVISKKENKKCIKASLCMPGKIGELVLKFLPTGYMWYVNYTENVAELCIISEDPEKEFNLFLETSKAKLISHKGLLLPIYKNERILDNNSLYYGGDCALINNNFNFYNFVFKIRFNKLTCNYAHELMFKKNISYYLITKDIDSELHYLEKEGNIFWNLNDKKKNEIIKKMDFKKFALDFSSGFKNSSKLSKINLKLLFK